MNINIKYRTNTNIRSVITVLFYYTNLMLFSHTHMKYLMHEKQIDLRRGFPSDSV